MGQGTNRLYNGVMAAPEQAADDRPLNVTGGITSPRGRPNKHATAVKPTRDLDMWTNPVKRIGCVSYLNAKPLIDGLDIRHGVSLLLDVPSRLLALLQGHEVDLALCPVVDYYRSTQPLEIVPVGGIGCCGATLTVKLFSRVPLDTIQEVHADPDSHTSVQLLMLVLGQSYGLKPRLVSYFSDESRSSNGDVPPEAMLLIGDKIITSCPSERVYPYTLDLGEAWHTLTGLPFVFATWMARLDSDLGDLPTLLRSQLRRNMTRLEQIAAQYAQGHGWEVSLAHRYLSQLMRYEVGPTQLHAIERFADMAHELGLIDQAQPLRLRVRRELTPG